MEQTQKNDYIHQFEQIKQLIINGTCQKAILSRLKIEPGVPSSQLLNLFDALCLLYPHAFVYLLNTPQTGVWSGASPELLLRKNNHSLHTVALAGTMPNATQHITWGQKELDEQAMVTNYIHDLFKKAGIHHYTTHVITSYSIHYTKLYEDLPGLGVVETGRVDQPGNRRLVQIRQRGRRRRAGKQPRRGRSRHLVLGAQGDHAGDQHPERVRITSYNVCYTKLLRPTQIVTS